MCNPIAIGATVMAGASVFSSTEKNKAANRKARAQAKAAYQDFFNQRVRQEINYDSSLNEIAAANMEADRQQAVEQHNLLVAIGDATPVGNSTSKLLQTSIANGALNIAALAGSKDNARAQAVLGFRDNESNYLGNIEKIKQDLNINYTSGTAMAVQAGTAALQGAAYGAQIKEATG